MADWARDAIFYHVYPLGFCGAPRRNDLVSAPSPRLDRLTADLARIAGLGFDALYLGPLFESVAHGYDPVDWRRVDRRLGDREALARLCAKAKGFGMRIVFDAVFNHVGREHPWFRALREAGLDSPEAARFARVRPGRSPYGESFEYEGWAGHYDLVKLNLGHGPTRAELIGAALSWIDDFGIDGIRIDAADCLDLGFLSELASACRARKGEFWLLGEAVGGDYRRLAGGEGSLGQAGPLDSVTNYECYKGLWSSHVDANYFEIAYSLERQFGEAGIYRGLSLYAFADNHDVDRVASKLSRDEQLYPLYCLLFTMPGPPSVYYGSERGAKARKAPDSDWPLRPSIEEALASCSQPDLEPAITRLARLRKRLRPLRRGGYRELALASESLVFEREAEGERAIVAVNGSSASSRVEARVGGPDCIWRDALNEGAAYPSSGGVLRLEVPPTWARVLTRA
jgi:glycosidase